MIFFKSLKGHKIYSILNGVCPVCQQESMYKEANSYKISRIFEMYDRCSHCNTKYKMEPSFFFGAMYVSYGVGIAFAVPVFVLAYFVFKLSLLWVFVAIVAVLILFLPIITRLSRNIWVNFFLDYNKKLANKVKGEVKV